MKTSDPGNMSILNSIITLQEAPKNSKTLGKTLIFETLALNKNKKTLLLCPVLPYISHIFQLVLLIAKCYSVLYLHGKLTMQCFHSFFQN